MAKKHEPVQTPLDTYRKEKLKALHRDFRITITDEEKRHAETLKTETQVDQFCITMLNKYWS